MTESLCFGSTLSPSLLDTCSLVWGLHSVLDHCSLTCYCRHRPCVHTACSLGPGEQCPEPSQQDHNLQKRLPLGPSADLLPHKKLPPEYPWPSLLGHRLTTMNCYQCLIILFTAFSRVGGLEPQPLIYKVIGETKIKQRKESSFPGSVGSALWGQR